MLENGIEHRIDSISTHGTENRFEKSKTHSKTKSITSMKKNIRKTMHRKVAHTEQRINSISWRWRNADGPTYVHGPYTPSAKKGWSSIKTDVNR